MIYGLCGCWSLAWFVVEALLYTTMGKVNYYSERAVKTWMCRVGAKGPRRLRSLRPIGVRVGSVYMIYRATVMYIFLDIANFTVQTVLVL